MEIDWSVFPTGDYKRDRGMARRFYDGIGVVRCPALGDAVVVFGAAGFKHLVYKPSRSETEIVERLSFLRHASVTVSTSNARVTYRKRSETHSIIRNNESRRPQSIDVHYWGIEAVIDGHVYVAVIRQIDMGQKHFYSIMKR